MVHCPFAVELMIFEQSENGTFSAHEPMPPQKLHTLDDSLVQSRSGMPQPQSQPSPVP